MSEAFDGRAFARTLTAEPGVYRMLGDADQALYIGKARNLRKRVESYFSNRPRDARITSMVMQVQRIEVIVTRTEAEALLLENQLIKALRPRYNIDLRDDKSYPWIRLTAGDAFPRVAFHRGARHAPDRFFGPFPSAWAVRETLDLVHKTFQLRSCEDSVFQHRTRPCLQHQIKRCSAPCVGLIGADDYASSVRHAALVLEGRSPTLIEELSALMDRAAGELDFERAARHRDQIAALRRVLAAQFVQGERGDLDVVACVAKQGKACVEVLFFRGGMSLGNRSYFPHFVGEAPEAEILRAFVLQHYTAQNLPSELLLSHELEDQDVVQDVLSQEAGRRVRLVSGPRGDRAKWLEMAQRTAEAALGTLLAANATLRTQWEDLTRILKLDAPPRRIECFDISHTQGENTVASCVVFDADGPLRTDYRRFNIEGIEPGDDYAAMRQALHRRFSRLIKGEGHAPDLVLIDGGMGQLNIAAQVLGELGLAGLPLVGVAKGPERRAGHETLLLDGGSLEIEPGPMSPGLHLIQKVRDEAHRFAITGHRARRAKARQRSALDDVPGIGAVRRRALLKAFGGIRGIERAGVEDLATVAGIDRSLAQRIYDAFHA
jgi:excinuclease ABC subunit C